jgi:hypothetical protein
MASGRVIADPSAHRLWSVAETSAGTIAVTGVLEGCPIAKPAAGSRAFDSIQQIFTCQGS